MKQRAQTKKRELISFSRSAFVKKNEENTSNSICRKFNHNLVLVDLSIDLSSNNHSNIATDSAKIASKPATCHERGSAKVQYRILSFFLDISLILFVNVVSEGCNPPDIFSRLRTRLPNPNTMTSELVADWLLIEDSKFTASVQVKSIT